MILILFLALRWSPLSSTYLRTSWTQVSTEIYRRYSHLSCFLLFVFRVLALRISQRSMLGECQGASLPFGIQRMCRSRRNLCSCPYVVRASTFLLNLVWTFCAFIEKNTLLVVFFSFCGAGSFCSRSECGKRKTIWDACVAGIKQDPVQQKGFDTQMLAVMETMG